jgi:hypothetical protein
MQPMVYFHKIFVPVKEYILYRENRRGIPGLVQASHVATCGLHAAYVHSGQWSIAMSDLKRSFALCYASDPGKGEGLVIVTHSWKSRIQLKSYQRDRFLTNMLCWWDSIQTNLFEFEFECEFLGAK